MQDCCKDTYKATLQEVIIVIEQNNITSIERLVETLKHAIIRIDLADAHLQKSISDLEEDDEA